MPTKNAKRGHRGGNIGSHGTAIVVSDVGSGLLEPYDVGSTFQPETPAERPGGAQIFKFPLDDVSAGNFWTRLIINSWIPVKREEIVQGQGHGLDKDSIANIWLPMPLGLTTGYAQNYSEAENMMVTQGSGQAESMAKQGQGMTGAMIGQLMNEIGSGLNSVAGVNSSGKMAMGSIVNNNMGLVYDGASLRSHELSWRMTPKNREEQAAIETVCFAMKKFAAPIVKGPMGGDVSAANSAKAHQKSMKDVKATEGGGIKAVAAGLLTSDIQDSMKSIGRLGIPVTVNVEFWFQSQINPHLFQIKDSFITNVSVNYTPTGTWNAYEDGSPVETQLSITLKENAIITQEDIKQVGGY
jgi:hypothetical protein